MSGGIGTYTRFQPPGLPYVDIEPEGGMFLDTDRPQQGDRDGVHRPLVGDDRRKRRLLYPADFAGGERRPNKSLSKIRAMVSSAMVFLTVIAWADAFQEYLAYEDPVDLPDEPPDSSKRRRLYRRLVFATVVTIATFIIVGWLSQCPL